MAVCIESPWQGFGCRGGICEKRPEATPCWHSCFWTSPKDTLQDTAAPSSQAAGTSGKTLVRRGKTSHSSEGGEKKPSKQPCRHQCLRRIGRKCSRQQSRDSPAARKRPQWSRYFPCGVLLEQISTLQPTEDPTLQQVDISLKETTAYGKPTLEQGCDRNCSLWRTQAGAGSPEQNCSVQGTHTGASLL